MLESYPTKTYLMAYGLETLELLNDILAFPPTPAGSHLDPYWTSFGLSAAPEIIITQTEQGEVRQLGLAFVVHAEHVAGDHEAYARWDFSANTTDSGQPQPVIFSTIQAGVETDERYLQLEAVQQGENEPRRTVRTGPAKNVPALVSWGGRKPLELTRPILAGDDIYRNGDLAANPTLGLAAQLASEHVASMTSQTLQTYKELAQHTFFENFARR